jgi:hypothetical protein
MTWIKFLCWLAGIYVSYYAAIVLWDTFARKRGSQEADAHELTFVEHIEPQLHQPEAADDLSASAMVSSGGVNLKQLFRLAQEEAVEFTRAVSF